MVKNIEVKSENILPISTTDFLVSTARHHNSKISNQKLKKALSGIGFIGEYPKREHVEEHIK